MARILFIACGLAVLLFLAALVLGDSLSGPARWRSVVAQSYDLVRKRYVEELGPEELTTRALRGLFESLDGFSQFLTPSEYGAFQQTMRGDYGGVGIAIEKSERGVLVLAPIIGGAAFEAGIRPSDIITRIDGKETAGMSLAEARNLMRGEAGSSVRLEVLRPATGISFEATLVRRNVHLPSVMSARLLKAAGAVGYAMLSDFQEDAAEKLAEALNNLLRQRMQAFILDVRGNGGGVYKSALQVADLFLKSGVIVRVRYRSGEEQVERASPACLGDFPMVVLVDSGSASASEIVASALRDNNRASLLGTPTYGKGSVQQVFEMRLPDGRTAAARMTVAHFYSPAGEPISRELKAGRKSAEPYRDESLRGEPGPHGIVPDVLVRPTEAEESRIREALRNEWVLSNTGSTPGPLIEEADPQVMKALEILRSAVSAVPPPVPSAEGGQDAPEITQ